MRQRGRDDREAYPNGTDDVIASEAINDSSVTNIKRLVMACPPENLKTLY